ncbi:hypothetical protein DW928_15920 [Firmicutes bacterium AM43-11BH]|nr:hypothetical protein DW928_15920 [Firmicutes bacterium AM43-11BH]
MQLYMPGRLKNICKSKEEQVADTIGLKKSICNNEYQGSADTSVVKKHLRQRINRGYRYIRFQKSKSFIIPPISITIHHKARKRLCNPANWSRACPTPIRWIA